MGLIRAFAELFLGMQPQEHGHNGSEERQPVEHIKRTVLIIDDDPTFLELIQSQLRAAGFNVLTSNTGAKGLNLVRYAPRDIHVVLLDYRMPQLDGSATLDYLRKLGPNLKVLGVTGEDPKQVPAAFREGVDAVILKPFKSDRLISCLDALLNGGTQPPTSSEPQKG